jgi:hypothetical protein
MPFLKRLRVPSLFLLVSILAFGLQIPWQGFYLDDWIILHAFNSGGASRLAEYALGDNRPMVYWLWWLGFVLFGSGRIYWQIWALVWRWLSVLMLWLGWREMWPNYRRQTVLAALLFAVYPLFRQQASALTYSFHWICFFLYGLSIYLMILSVKHPRYYWLLTIGSIISGAAQLFSQEFFVGLELLRPVILGIVFNQQMGLNGKALVKRVLRLWLPYLGMLVLYGFWRFVWMPIPGIDRNAPALLSGLVRGDVATLKLWVQMFLQDTVQILLGVWYSTYQPELFSFSTPSNMVAWVVVLITFGLIFVYFRFFQVGKGLENQEPEPDYKTAIIFGAAAMLLGFLPGWSIGRQVYDLTGIYNDRFGLAAMFGAAWLVVGFSDLLIKKVSYRNLILWGLIALSAGQGFRVMSTYRWSWENQTRLFWQLKWRAPALKSPTAIVGDGALVTYIGSWANTSAFLQMYASVKNTINADFWYFDLQKYDVSPTLGQQEPLADDKKFLKFKSSADQAIVISFEQSKGQCLWVLGPQDKDNVNISSRLRDAMSLSQLSRIQDLPDTSLRLDIFGPEIPRDWCYYFEQGDLARQSQNWDKVLGLWKEAEAKNFKPNIGVEYGPFIEGAAHTQNWDLAADLTLKANKPDYQMYMYLCDTWKRILSSTSASPAREEALSKVRPGLNCPVCILP